MSINEQYYMAKRLRDLIRDTQHPNEGIPASRIADLAEELEAEAEKMEMDMIVWMQRSNLGIDAQK